MSRIFAAAFVLAALSLPAATAKADPYHHGHGYARGRVSVGYQLPRYGPRYGYYAPPNCYYPSYKAYYGPPPVYPGYGYRSPYYGPRGVYIQGRNYSFHYGF